MSNIEVNDNKIDDIHKLNKGCSKESVHKTNDKSMDT